MDADLEAMRSINRYSACVDCFLEPLLRQRKLAPMPCKHNRTFERARDRLDSLDFELDDDDDYNMPMGYCDCGAFNRRNALWEIGDLAVKYSLSRNQLSQLAAIIILVTRDVFTYNHVKRAKCDLFQGAYKGYLRAVDRKRDDGVSFDEIAVALIPKWQHRMMPNI